MRRKDTLARIICTLIILYYSINKRAHTLVLEQHASYIKFRKSINPIGQFIWFLFLMLASQTMMSQKLNHKIYDIRHGLSQMKVSSILEDSRGYIWVGTRNGLNRFDGESFITFSTEDGLLNDRILGLLEHIDGRLTILTSDGISFFDGKYFENYKHNFPEVEYQLLRNTQGYYYACGRYLTIFLPNGQYKVVKSLFGRGFMEPTHDHFVFACQDTISIYNADTCLFQYPQTRSVMLLTTLMSPTDQYGKNATSDSFFVLDRNSYLWRPLASEVRPELLPNEVSYLDERYLYANDNRYDISLKRAHALYQCKNGDLLVGTDEGLIRYYESQFVSIPAASLPYAWSIVDDADHVYFGSYGSGLFRMTKHSKKIENVFTERKLFHCGASKSGDGVLFFPANLGLISINQHVINKNYLPISVLYSVYDDPRDQLVVGIHDGIAMLRRGGDFIKIGEPHAIHSCNYIQTITIGPQRAYWCGSYFGLTRYNPETNVSEHFSTELNTLPNGPGIFCGLTDTQNRLWLGGSEGLCYWDEDSNELKKVHIPMLETQIKSIIQLDEHSLLLGSKDELLTFDTDSFFLGIESINFYNNSNGFDGIEPGFTGFYRDLENNIWITSSSHTSYLSDSFKLNKNMTLRPRINSIAGFETSLSLDTDTINLSTGENILLTFEAIGAERPQQLKYSTRIDDGPWSTWQKENRRVINLKHGRHQVDVAVGPSNRQDMLHHSAIIFVTLPIYQRAFFIPTLLSIVLLLLSITIFNWWRRRKEREQYLIQLEESRYLRSQLLLSELNPHFIFNVLASIQNKILKGEKQEANNKLVQLSGLIRNFLNVSYKSNDPKNRLEHEITLSKEIDLLKSYLNFEQSNSNNHFVFEIQIHPNCEPTQIMIPPMLIQPFVENAVKHGVLPNARKGLIAISFIHSNNALTCIVRDNGEGISNTASHPESVHHQKSLGSTIVNDRIHVLNQLGYHIEVKVDEPTSGGTRVTITIFE